MSDDAFGSLSADELVNTDSATIDRSDTTGVTTNLLTYSFETIHDIYDSFQYTNTISDSAKKIYSLTTDTRDGAFVIVNGRDGTNEFLDLVVFHDNSASVDVVNSFNYRDSPSARTYSTSSFDPDLDLAMANSSDSYQTGVRGIEVAWGPLP